MKLALATVTAALLFAFPSLASADSSCLCSVSYVVRPCDGTLTKTEGRTARQRYQCHKRSTKILTRKDRSRKFTLSSQCRNHCKRFGRKVMGDVEDGAICRARPGQRIITKLNAYFKGGKPIRDRQRKSRCPRR